MKIWNRYYPILKPEIIGFLGNTLFLLTVGTWFDFGAGPEVNIDLKLDELLLFFGTNTEELGFQFPMNPPG